MPSQEDLSDAVHPLMTQGYSFVAGDRLYPVLVGEKGATAWDLFADSWNRLAPDLYMADHGRYRKRRYGVYRVTDSTITRQPHQAHYQSLDYNPLNGGIDRWFDPIEDEVGTSPVLHNALRISRDMATKLHPAIDTWHVEVHQFRIEAKAGESGKPTPEGMHRDERDFVLVVLINRVNIREGVTNIHNLHRDNMGSFTLTHPGDAAMVDDRRVYHGVTAVEPDDPHQQAYRDVLVVTLRGLKTSPVA